MENSRLYIFTFSSNLGPPYCRCYMPHDQVCCYFENLKIIVWSKLTPVECDILMVVEEYELWVEFRLKRANLLWWVIIIISSTIIVVLCLVADFLVSVLIYWCQITGCSSDTCRIHGLGLLINCPCSRQPCGAAIRGCLTDGFQPHLGVTKPTTTN